MGRKKDIKKQKLTEENQNKNKTIWQQIQHQFSH
jgi:hypothetical protein